jgi:excisionase family DNA binding protein
MTEKLLTQREVCRLLQVSPKTLQRLRRRSMITFVQFGYHSIRFRQDEVEEFIRRQESRQ